MARFLHLFPLTARVALTAGLGFFIAAGGGAPSLASETETDAPGNETRIVLTAERVWDFAESLFRQGEYYRAVSEYQRLLHFFPRSEQAPAARIRIGEAYLLGGEAELAVRYFSVLLERAGSTSRDGLLYLRGMAWLERGSARPYSLRMEDIKAGLRDFRALAPDSPQGRAAAPFVAAMAVPQDVPYKSPLLAGSLSAVLPGAGSVYVGRYAEGALAFFVNTLFIVSTVSAFQNDQPALGAVLGVIALAFYGGSIYAAVNGAHKHNDRALAAYLDDQRVRFGIVLLPGGAGASIRGSF
jgi:tetratricopeptide (TPR) repeat protein